MANTQGIQAGKAFVSLYLDDNPLTRGLKTAEGKLKAFGNELQSIGKSMMLAGGAILGPLLGGTKMFGSIGDGLNDMSKKTGMSVAALSELGHVAKLSGADLDSVQNGVKGMARVITEAGRGTETAIESLAALGLSFSDLENLSPEDRFTTILDRLGGITDETYRAAIAQEVLGKSGMNLLPMADLRAGGINAGRQQARDNGLSWTKEDAELAGELDDTLTLLGDVVKKLAVDIGSALAPAITDMAKWITNVVVSASEFIKNNKEIVVTVAKIAAVVLGTGAALSGFGFAMIGISKAIGTLLFGLKLIAGVFGFILSPMTLVIAGIGVATALLVSHFDVIKNVGNGISGTFSQAANWISTSNNIVAQSLNFLGQSVKTTFSLATTTFSGIRDALKAGDIEAAFDIAVLGLKAIWKKFSFDFKAIWYGVQEVLLSAWFSTVEAIKNKFNDVLNFFGKVQNKVSEWMMEATLWVMGESDNPYAKDTLAKMTESSKNETEADYRRRQDEIAEESRKNNEALDLLRAEHTNNLIKQDEELAAATKRLQDATNKAADAVKSKEEKDAEAKDDAEKKSQEPSKTSQEKKLDDASEWKKSLQDIRLLETERARAANVLAARIDVFLAKTKEEKTKADSELATAERRLASIIESREVREARARAATIPDVSGLLSGVGAAISVQASTIFGTFNAMGGLQGWGYGNNSEWQATLKAIANNTKSTADNTEEIKNKDGMTFTDS